MKLGIIGSGFIVREVLPHLRDWGWEPAAICTTARSSEKTKELCDVYRIAAQYTDSAKMHAETEMDAVYIAVPNHLHYMFAKEALESGHNVILEKPLTSTVREAQELAALARRKDLFLFEAVTTIHLPDYARIKELLARIGQVKIVSCNYSQYSRRYDAFRRGEILPAFDPAKSGGALMDLNLYNIHYVTGLFGRPQHIAYQANTERSIDTNGILTLDYDSFHAVCIGAKDCSAPSGCVIQGTEGYICQNTSANVCGGVTLHKNNGTEEFFDENPPHRMESEFRFFAREISSGDRSGCYRLLSHSLLVADVTEQARRCAGIHFPADESAG